MLSSSSSSSTPEAGNLNGSSAGLGDSSEKSKKSAAGTVKDRMDMSFLNQSLFSTSEQFLQPLSKENIIAFQDIGSASSSSNGHTNGTDDNNAVHTMSFKDFINHDDPDSFKTSFFFQDGIKMISNIKYVAQNSDELSFEANEFLYINFTFTHPVNINPKPGYYLAFHPRTRRIGLCPVNSLSYINRVESNDDMKSSLDGTTSMGSASYSSASSGSVTAAAASSMSSPAAIDLAASSTIPPEHQEKKNGETKINLKSLVDGSVPRPRTRYGKQSGYAVDVVVIRGYHGELRGTSFHVRFTGPSADISHVNDPINVYVNGIPRLEMVMGLNGVATFKNGKLRCSELERLFPEEIDKKSKEGRIYTIRFEHICPEIVDSIRFCDAVVYVWDVADYLVVSDIDGTITRNDIGGMWNTTIRIKAGFMHKGYAHDGICTLFQKIVSDARCHIIYLTARPMDLVDVTRTYIHTLNQQGRSLPPGPVITDRTNYIGSLRREVIDKTSHEFKTEMLLELRNCFAELGRDVIAQPVYVAGFGNKETDAIAYEAAGVPTISTYIVDPRSSIKVRMGNAEAMQSYGDVKMDEWLFKTIKMIKDGNLPLPPVRESNT